MVAGVGVVAVSLRHFFPEPWDGMGHGFTIAQYVVNMVAFIENLGVGTLCLMGHTRGGHIAFRLAQRRAGPLAEAGPGARRRSGYFSDRRSVSSPIVRPCGRSGGEDRSGRHRRRIEPLSRCDRGPEGGLRLPAAAKQWLRDNAYTLLEQANEHREPYSRAGAESIRVPTLFIGGQDTLGPLPTILRALAAHVPGTRTTMIPNTTHPMFEQDSVRFQRRRSRLLGIS